MAVPPSVPPTPRWFTDNPAGHSTRYVARFRELVASGSDVDGEARLVDALLPRGARVLDAGCGPGRVGAALFARGHTVVGVDADAELIAAAREDHPGPDWQVGDLTSWRGSAPFDAIALPGNVLVFLAPGTEATVLANLAGQLTPDGFLVAGFATDRAYRVADLDRDLAAAGLVVEHRFATWDVRAWHDDADWAVTVARHRP